MTWTLAPSLVRLREQINAAYPNRSKISDGTIGDAAHAKTVSDHNPNENGVVTAFDITHDPAGGLDIDKLSDFLADSRDPRIKYLIANRKILIPAEGWHWQIYTGDDPHTSHLHVSVRVTNDNTNDWNIGKGDDDMITKDDTALVRIINSEAKGYPFHETHAGQFDKTEMDFWTGRSWRDFVWGAWNDNGAWRERRMNALNFYDKYNGIINDLSSRPTKGELQAAVDKMSMAITQAQLAEKKAVEAANKATRLEAQAKSDMEAGQTLSRRIGQWISKYLPDFFKK